MKTGEEASKREMIFLAFSMPPNAQDARLLGVKKFYTPNWAGRLELGVKLEAFIQASFHGQEWGRSQPAGQDKVRQ